MTKKIIAFDVDGTVVDSGMWFSNWLQGQYWFLDKFPSSEYAEDYAWTEYTPWEGIDLHPQYIQLAKDWWKQKNLYISMEPIDGAVEALQELHELGHTIIFASHCEGDHAKSKVEFLKHFFPFMSGFLATRQKQFVRCDVLIDDRAYNLNNLPKGVKPIYKCSRYGDKDFHTLSHDIDVIPNFDNLKEVI